MVFHGFLRTAAGAITILDAPGAGTTGFTGTQVNDIGSSGAIVGSVSGTATGTHSFILSSAGTYTVFDPTGTSASQAHGINDSGAIVGQYVDTNLTTHGYIRNADGTFVMFEDPNGADLPNTLSTVSRRVNAGGAIIGQYYTPAAQHGYIRQ